MGTTMDRWYSACGKRCSVREYSNAAFSLQQLADIKELISELSCDEARLVLLKDGEALKAPFFSPQLVGARYSVAVVASQNYEYVAGSIGEAFVLECASMDIGTCWLAKFNKRYVSSHVSLKGSQRVPCLIAFGYTDIPLKCKKKGKRSPIEITGLSDVDYAGLRLWQQKAAECAAIAPTARNKQEFELEFSENSVSAYLTSSNGGFAGIDCGIIMLHVELGAYQIGKCGEWEIVDGIPTFTII